MNKHQAKIRPGFSLIELLVAMGMIGIGLLGVASLAAQNVRVQYFNRNSLISSQLAQEGLELARNLRDNDWKSDSPVTSSSSLDNLYYPGFTIDYHGNQDVYNTIEETPSLSINEYGLYDYTGIAITPFKRFLTSDCQGDHCRITCYVSWQAQGQTGVYQAESDLYAWNQ